MLLLANPDQLQRALWLSKALSCPCLDKEMPRDVGYKLQA